MTWPHTLTFSVSKYFCCKIKKLLKVDAAKVIHIDLKKKKKSRITF